MVTILERKGLVVRTPDPGNRHIKRINLTADGKVLMAKCDLQIDRFEARMLEALDVADVETLRKSLAACVTSLTD